MLDTSDTIQETKQKLQQIENTLDQVNSSHGLFLKYVLPQVTTEGIFIFKN